MIYYIDMHHLPKIADGDPEFDTNGIKELNASDRSTDLLNKRQ